MESAAARRACWIGALLPVCFAIWLHGPMWDGGLLSDDLLLRAYVFDAGAHGQGPAWRRVWEDLQGPWLFGQCLFYRPLVTFTYVLECWLGGDAEHVPHVTNLALFVVCVLGVGRLAGRLGGAWAAFAAGLLFAAHPIAHEPICWPCARADLLVVVAALAACSALLRHRRAAGGLPRTSLFLACLLALLAKESAILLAPLLVVFDVALGSGMGGWRRRALLHLALLPLWGVYFWWRMHIGVMPALDLPTDLDWSSWPALQFERLSRLVAPGVTPSSAITVGLFTAFAVLAALVTRGARRWLAFAASWLVLTFAPTSWQPVFSNLHNGRFVLLAATGLAVAAGLMIAATMPRGWAWAGRAMLLIAALDMAAGVRTLQDGYERQWQRMRALRDQMASRAGQATVAAPLVPISFHLGHDNRLPFLDPERAYSLAIRPLVAEPIPFVSLGSVLDATAGPELMQGDVVPWRVMWQHGAMLVYWLGHDTGGELVTIAGQAATPRFVAGPAGFEPAERVASPWAIGSFEVVAAAAFDGGRVVWQSATGHVGAFRLDASRPTGADHRQRLDVSTDPAFLIFGTLGGITRVAVELDGPRQPRAAELVASPMPAFAPLRSPFRGAPLALAGVGVRLAWSELPADADPGSANVVLMNRSFGFRLARPASERGELPRSVRLRLWQSGRVGDDGTTWYYLECRVGGRPWRTAVDWFVDPRSRGS